LLLKKSGKLPYNSTGYHIRDGHSLIPHLVIDGDRFSFRAIARKLKPSVNIIIACSLSSGPRLGRPKKNEIHEHNKQTYIDSCERNAVEGVFGTGKRKYGLDRIMAHLKNTSECVIAMNFFIMNMEHKWRLFFVRFVRWLFENVFSIFTPNLMNFHSFSKPYLRELINFYLMLHSKILSHILADFLKKYKGHLF
jgi:hypothetical protein